MRDAFTNQDPSKFLPETSRRRCLPQLEGLIVDVFPCVRVPVLVILLSNRRSGGLASIQVDEADSLGLPTRLISQSVTHPSPYPHPGSLLALFSFVAFERQYTRTSAPAEHPGRETPRELRP